jgi:hypothetical protein
MGERVETGRLHDGREVASDGFLGEEAVRDFVHSEFVAMDPVDRYLLITALLRLGD